MIPISRRALQSYVFQVVGPRLTASNNVSYQQVRGRKARYRKPQDPNQVAKIKEYTLISKNKKPNTLLYTWGVSDTGALGRASFVRPDPAKRQSVMHFKYHPHRLGFGEFFKVVDIACGYGFSVFAVNSKPVSCFGTGINTDSQIGTHQPRVDHPLGILIQPGPIEVPLTFGGQVKKVACGRAHTIMITDKEGVWTVGNNAYGQCGRPIIDNEDFGRTAIYHRVKVLDDVTIQQIECGQDTSFFLSDAGLVYSCGWGADGQSGRGHYDNESQVAPVQGDLSGEKIIKVSCRADCALALNDKGEVFGWGNNEYQQLSSVTEDMQIHTPRRLKLPDVGKIVDVASAGTMCLILNEDGDVFSWGFGCLGKGPTVSYSKMPTQIPSTLFGRTQLTPEAKVVSLHCGISSFAAVNNYSSLFTWGKNPGGCLGLRHLKDQYFPFRVALSGKILKVSCGVDHMAAIVKDII